MPRDASKTYAPFDKWRPHLFPHFFALPLKVDWSGKQIERGGNSCISAAHKAQRYHYKRDERHDQGDNSGRPHISGD